MGDTMYLSEGTGDVRTAYIFENADDAKESFDMSHNNPRKFAKCIRTEERLMPSEDARWWIDISDEDAREDFGQDLQLEFDFESK